MPAFSFLRQTIHWSVPSLLTLGGPLFLASLLVSACHPWFPVNEPSVETTDETLFLFDPVAPHYDPIIMIKHGEVFMDREDWHAAAAQFSHILELYPHHLLAPYLHLRLGDAYAAQVTAHDRDTQSWETALIHYDIVLSHSPTPAHRLLAHTQRNKLREQLAKKTFMIGEYYLRRDNYFAAAHRFAQVLQVYPETSMAPSARQSLLTCYHHLQLPDWAILLEHAPTRPPIEETVPSISPPPKGF